MSITRRDFLKTIGAGVAIAGVAGSPEAASGAPVPEAKIKGAQAVTSICPYCGVGCGLVAYVKDGKLVGVEGDPEHPINQGSLCSKGQAVFEIVTSPRRLTKVKYRAPGSDHWEDKDLDWAIQTLAQRIKATRDANFIAKNSAGVTVNRTEAIASIGAAALNNEECYLISKLMRSLGIVYLEHQARL